MRVAVLGTGALGCVFAARLSTEAEVWVLGTWEAGIHAIRERGILIQEPDGSVTRRRVAGACLGPIGVPKCDTALLLVKSYQTDRGARWAADVLKPGGIAISMQNGLDNSPRLAAAVGTERAAIGVNYVGATYLGPGEARFIVSLTSYIGLAPSKTRLDAACDLLNRSGLKTRLVKDIESRLWGKAVINAAINPLTALWRVPNGELLASPERRELLSALAIEAASVAEASGIALPYADPVAATETICAVSATNHSSMLQDVERGRPTEIDSINGIIVEIGRRVGVPTPHNEAVWRLVRALSESGQDHG